jgi:hypothetical protein
MDSRPCDALREIEIGGLTFQHFAPPRVFVSGVYDRFGVTVSDLRWHLPLCQTCEAIFGVENKLADFDRLCFEKLIELAASLQECLEARIREEEEYAEAYASSCAEEFVGEQQHFGYSRELLFEAEKEFRLQESRPKIYYWAVRLHAAFGGVVARWLETLLDPAFPRVLVYGEAGLADVRIRYSEGREAMRLPSELAHLLTMGRQDVAAPLLRALLLAEALGGLVDKADLSELITEGEELIRHGGGGGGPAIDWEMVWKHYSAFAVLESARVLPMESIAAPSLRALPREDLEIIGRSLQVIEQRTEDLLQGQTAMMERQCEMEKAERQLLNAFEKSSTQNRESCQDRVKESLGGLYDLLDDPARKFLVSAEFGCDTTPPDLDFSGAIVLFTKAFEHELHRALKPLRSDLERACSNDLAEMSKTLENLTLGNWEKLLKKHTEDLTPSFQAQGFNLLDIRKAINKVNGEKMAKHAEEKSRAVAVKFRGLFLDSRPSVFAPLFPSRGHNGMGKR